MPHCWTPRLKHACTYTSTTRKPHHQCLNSHPPHTKFRIFVRACLSKFFLSQCFVADKDREEEHLQRTEKGKKKKREKLLNWVVYKRIMGSKVGNNNYDYSFKVLLIGDSGVGKSSLLLSFISNFVHDLSPTIGTFSVSLTLSTIYSKTFVPNSCRILSFCLFAICFFVVEEIEHVIRLYLFF